MSDAIDDREEAKLCDAEDAEASEDVSRLDGSFDEDEDPDTDADRSEVVLSSAVNDDVDASDEELDVVALSPKLDASETDTGVAELDGKGE